MKIPTGEGVVSNRQTSTGNISSIATQGAVSTFGSIMEAVDKHLDERAEMEAQDARNNLRKQTNDLMMKYKEKQGKEALGSTESFQKEYDELHKSYTSTLSKRGQTKFGDFGDRIGEDMRVSVMMHEKDQEHKAKASIFDSGLTQAEEVIRQDASNWQTGMNIAVENLETARKGGLIKEEDFESKKTDVINRYRAETGKNYYTQNKHEFMKKINEFGFGKPEIAAYKKKYSDDLAAEEREKKSLFSEEARSIMGSRDDMKAQALVNGDTAHFKTNAEKLRKMGYHDYAKELEKDGMLYDKVISFDTENKNKSLAEKLQAANALDLKRVGERGSSSAYPEGEFKGLVEKGNIALDKRPVVKNDDGSISTVRSMSVNMDGKEVLIPTVSPDGKILSEDDAIKHYRKTGEHLGKFDTPEQATAYAEKLHSAQEGFYSKTGLDGSAEQLEANNAIKTEMKKQVQIFNSDPSGFVSNWAVGSTPEEMAASRLSLQQKQGIAPEKGFKVLTNEEAKNFKSAWESGDVKQRAALVTEANKYGKYASKVLGEMEINSALTLTPWMDQRDSELLVSAVSEKPEAFDDASLKEHKSAARESKVFQLLTKASSEIPTDFKMASRLKDFESAMVGISTKKMDPDAGAEFLDSKFEVEEDTDKMIFFPKSVDSDDVISTLDKKKAEIANSIGANDVQKGMSAKWAVRDYKWVNNATGFVLVDTKIGRMVPGSQVEYGESSPLLKEHMAKKKAEPPKVTATERVNSFLFK